MKNRLEVNMKISFYFYPIDALSNLVTAIKIKGKLKRKNLVEKVKKKRMSHSCWSAFLSCLVHSGAHLSICLNMTLKHGIGAFAKLPFVMSFECLLHLQLRSLIWLIVQGVRPGKPRYKSFRPFEISHLQGREIGQRNHAQNTDSSPTLTCLVFNPFAEFIFSSWRRSAKKHFPKVAVTFYTPSFTANAALHAILSLERHFVFSWRTGEGIGDWLFWTLFLVAINPIFF